MNIKWTQEEIDKAINLRDQRLSYSKIGKQIGKSKSAIAGFFNRRGLQALPKTKPFKPAKKAVSRFNAPIRTRTIKAPTKDYTLYDDKEKTAARERVSKLQNGVDLEHIKNGQCKGVLRGEKSSIIFCGEPVKDDKSVYCADHHSLYHNKTDYQKQKEKESTNAKS